MSLVLVVLCLSGVLADSYLDAYEESHGTTVSDREYSEPYPYPPSQPGYQYGPPKYQYGPPAAPVHNYGPPAPAAPVFAPSAPSYGPPAPAYGPPAPVYGPPAPPIYGMPHGMLSFFDKLKLKLDLFTVGKILLKIVLFKKFVSFVAVLCLLLFIPHLKHKVDEAVPDGGDDDDDDAAMRGFGPKKYRAGDKFLDNITQFVVGAIDNFSKNYTISDDCDSVYCKTQRVVQGIDNKLSYRKLAEVYSKEIKS